MKTDARKWMIILLLLAVFFVQSGISLTSQSATWDETGYYGIGAYLFKTLRWDIMGSILHPPLTYYLSSIPLLFVDLDNRYWEYRNAARDLSFLGTHDYARGQAILSLPQNHGDRLLIMSRLITALLGLLLGVYVYLFSSSLYGESSGLLSLFLFAFCPNMLAFSGITIPDMPLTAFSFISTYYLWSCLRRDNLRDALFSGIALGLALLSKFTALLLLPAYAVLFMLFRIKERKKIIAPMAIVFAVSFFILFLGYGFSLTPYFQGIQFQWSHGQDGHPSFLMGEHSLHGWWYFYIVAFLLKTPIPILVMLVLSLILLIYRRKSDWIDILFLVLPIAVITLFFSLASFTVGLRYILPIYPFIFAIIGSLYLYREKIKYLIYAMGMWYVAASISVAPHYLAYFNEFIGGPKNGYNYLVGDNLDLGQDLKGLKKYMDTHGVSRISLSYSGTDSPRRYGIQYDWLPSYVLFDPAPDQPVVIRPDQMIAISVTNLQGVNFGDKRIYEWLKHYRPVDAIGYSILLYDLRNSRKQDLAPGSAGDASTAKRKKGVIEPNASIQYFYSYVEEDRGRYFMQQGHVDQAIERFTQSIALYGGRYSAYFERAIAFDNKGLTDNAIDDYTKAIELRPNESKLYAFRGFALLNAGLYDRAIEDYTNDILLNPSGSDAYNNRGVAYKHLGKFDQAIRDYSKAIELNPRFSLAYCNRGIVFGMMGHIDEALKDYTEALSLQPDLVKAYLERGALYERSGSMQRAADDYSSACMLGDDAACSAIRARAGTSQK